MKKNIEIVLMGDSITGRGDWKNLLNKQKLVNLGVDGDTTKGILNRINTVIQLEPKMVLLMGGINDLCISIPLEESFKNYKKILKKLQEIDTKIVVQAILLTQMPSVNKKVNIFNSMLEEYCLKEEISFINLNKSFSNKKGLLKEELTTDGLHLGQKAYLAWAYKLKKELSL